MRKFFAIVLSITIIMGLSGCSNKTKTTEQYIPVGTYEMKESKEPMKPTVSLKDSNRFNYNYSMLSSYYCVGSYEEDGDNLILKTDDGEYKYVFKIKDNTLIFNAKESSEIPSFANVPDGTIFEYLDGHE